MTDIFVSQVQCFPRDLASPGQTRANIQLPVAVVALKLASAPCRFSSVSVFSSLHRTETSLNQTSLATRDLSISALCGPHLLLGQYDGLFPNDGFSSQ